MAEIPHAVLSEHFQERMKGWRLRSAVFLTYLFDPGFFEQEILPVFLDIPLSHAAVIRLVQLEDALRSLPGQIAVFYDANGLGTSDLGSAKLDIKRIPVQHQAIFHPKNVLLLVESEVADEHESRSQALIVASLSANLTRSGWWENVEVCHVEKIVEGEKSRLKEDLISFLDMLRRKVRFDKDLLALKEILGFLRGTQQRQQRSSAGLLHTHFFGGAESIPKFLEDTAGDLIQNTYLEVISPYFDDAQHCKPLLDLIDRFHPREVRVFLPRASNGEALCRAEIYHSVRDIEGVSWGHLPKDMLRMGRSEDAGERFVHAKLYRFFTQNPKREICFVGSANLTTPAHQTGGNVETGFLVDMEPSRRPEFWLVPDERPVASFHVQTEDDAATAGGTRLGLKYHWDRSVAEAFWDAPGSSPALRIEARGHQIGTVDPIASRTWITLDEPFSKRLAQTLEETSLLSVFGDGSKEAYLLVQEEGMSHKPSLLLHLSANDILRYWSLLNPEQRAAFLEAHAPEMTLLEVGADLVTKSRAIAEANTLFDRFAGFFHAFSCLEQTIRAALKKNNHKEASYRLFGKKYDSLGSLMDRVLSETAEDADTNQIIDQYVIIQCARQICRELSRDYPDYWGENAADARLLEERFTAAGTLRKRLMEQGPANFSAFLDWFDRWFICKAKLVEVDD